MPEEQIKELAAKGITDYKQKFAKEIVDARTAYHNVLSSELIFTGHANDLADLAHLCNTVMMKKDRLPATESLEGLLVLRSAWDIVDIGEQHLKFFKYTAKICYVLLLLLSIAIVCVTVETTNVDASLQVTVAASGTQLQGAQLIIFCLSTAATFVAAVNAFYNPVKKWHQVRDGTWNVSPSAEGE